jgi:hypothetical protein
MILDFKINKVFIAFSLIIGFSLAFYLRLNDMTWLFIGIILVLFGFLTYFQVKRNTFRFIQNYEMVLMIKLEAKPYLEAYQALVEKGTRFNPVWTITKHQRLAMGYVFSGNYEEAKTILQNIEDEFKAFLELDTYSTYLNKVIGFLIPLFEQRPLTTPIKNAKAAFHELPIKAQAQLKDNLNGYHQLILLVEKLSQDNAKEGLIEAYEARTDFMKVILAHAYPEALSSVVVPEHQLF